MFVSDPQKNKLHKHLLPKRENDGRDEAVPLVVATFVVTIFAVFAIKKCTHSSGSIPGELRLHNLSYISRN